MGRNKHQIILDISLTDWKNYETSPDYHEDSTSELFLGLNEEGHVISSVSEALTMHWHSACGPEDQPGRNREQQELQYSDGMESISLLNGLEEEVHRWYEARSNDPQGLLDIKIWPLTDFEPTKDESKFFGIKIKNRKYYVPVQQIDDFIKIRHDSHWIIPLWWFNQMVPEELQKPKTVKVESKFPIMQLPVEVRQMIWQYTIFNERGAQEGTEVNRFSGRVLHYYLFDYAKSQLQVVKELPISLQGSSFAKLLKSEFREDFLSAVLHNVHVYFTDSREFNFFIGLVPIKYIRQIRHLDLEMLAPWQWIDFFGGGLLHPTYNTGAVTLPFMNLATITLNVHNMGKDEPVERRNGIRGKIVKSSIRNQAGYDFAYDAVTLRQNKKWLYNPVAPCMTHAVDWLLQLMFPFVPTRHPVHEFDPNSPWELNPTIQQWGNHFEAMYNQYYKKVRDLEYVPKVRKHAQQTFARAEAIVNRQKELFLKAVHKQYRLAGGCYWVDKDWLVHKKADGGPPGVWEYDEDRNWYLWNIKNGYYQQRPACKCSPPCGVTPDFYDDGEEWKHQQWLEQGERELEAFIRGED
ncbi:hypothetical protein BT63DRAFT_441729 [Microthyrium microscopicum]|uniref:Uncharacterized protein n=1 Tax=Microthyrium microscopicum TaxID=703497 RepID=A0A6A6U2W7_9PEZI|nr:hypothetical protein BT63DRAFT_441729 [Microthyrium microscopicum]